MLQLFRNLTWKRKRPLCCFGSWLSSQRVFRSWVRWLYSQDCCGVHTNKSSQCPHPHPRLSVWKPLLHLTLSWWIVLISYCVCNVLPQICSFQQYKLLTLLRVRRSKVSLTGPKSRCQQGWFLLEPLGKFYFLALSNFRDHLHFIGSWPPSSVLTSSIASLLSDSASHILISSL